MDNPRDLEAPGPFEARYRVPWKRLLNSGRAWRRCSKHIGSSTLSMKPVRCRRGCSRFEKRLAGTRTVDEGIDVLKGFLIQRLSDVQIDARVQMALERIEECSWQIRIGQLARDCQVSLRHLDRLLCN